MVCIDSFRRLFDGRQSNERLFYLEPIVFTSQPIHTFSIKFSQWTIHRSQPRCGQSDPDGQPQIQTVEDLKKQNAELTLKNEEFANRLKSLESKIDPVIAKAKAQTTTLPHAVSESADLKPPQPSSTVPA